jgi:DNA helicase-2/ATP-dependent DNA helicase PcrA
MYELNAEQRAAAEFKDGIGIVVAIPGSGKTLTMTHRIANLVKEGIPPENILGITFTKNAALTMKKRLRTLLDDRASRVSLSTVHSFCYNILKSEGRSFNLLLDFAKIVFIHRIMKRLKVKGLPIGLVIGEISLAKSNLIYPTQFIEIY